MNYEARIAVLAEVEVIHPDIGSSTRFAGLKSATLRKSEMGKVLRWARGYFRYLRPSKVLTGLQVFNLFDNAPVKVKNWKMAADLLKEVLRKRGLDLVVQVAHKIPSAAKFKIVSGKKS